MPLRAKKSIVGLALVTAIATWAILTIGITNQQLKQEERVAKRFLKALAAADAGEVREFVTPELYEKIEIPSKILGAERWSYDEPRAKIKQLSDGKCEVTLELMLELYLERGEQIKVPAKLVLILEKEEGMWKVAALTWVLKPPS